MASFVIENFSNGLDLRRSADTAPAGSLRSLKNAFINEGGEIEKRKSFAELFDVQEYTQGVNRKGKIIGPLVCPKTQGQVLFMHAYDTVATPGIWTAVNGVSSKAVISDPETEQFLEVYATKQIEKALQVDGTMRHASAGAAVFALGTMQYWGEWDNGSQFIRDYPIHVEFDAVGQEPEVVTHITDNNNHEAVFVHRNKGYSLDQYTLFASAVEDITDWVGTGSGAVDLNKQSSIPIGNGIGLSEYYGALAVFGQSGVQFWTVDADFAGNQYERTVKTSVLSPRSITSYGDGDLLYLSKSGLRSLRARDSSNFAKVSDVGSPIDKLLQAATAFNSTNQVNVGGTTLPSATFDYLAIGEVLEEKGQFWLFLRDKIYVLSNYPDAGVRAWSIYDLPEPELSVINSEFDEVVNRWCADACSVNETIMFRNFADEVYLYGGTGQSNYDTSLVEVITPHMDMGRPTNEKQIYGINLACFGDWTIEVSLDVNNVQWENIGVVTNSTHRYSGIVSYEARSTHIALRLTTRDARAAKLGQVAILYDDVGGK